MARPPRNTVDYFPYICKEGKAMYYIEEKYGNDGYATWFKILRMLAVTNFHFLNLNDTKELKFLSAKCKVSEEKMINIINDLCELSEFHSELWQQNRIIYSGKFVAHIRDAYKKRSNKCIDLKTLFIILAELGIRALDPLSIAIPDPTEIPFKVAEAGKGPEDLNAHYLDQLNNTDLILKAAQAAGWTIDQVKAKLPVFIKEKAQIEYRNSMDCKNHFKNWIVQESKKQKDNPSTPKKRNTI